jgi:hypothetical protein|tara:strand:- start:202 stop:621 length:420 start_codon:yes stop_codon:yes gene_type:complete
MANLKQKFIKPGRDYNYAEGVKVRAGAAITEGQVLYPSGSSGPFLVYSPSNGLAAQTTSAGRLLIAKHGIANDSYGIGLPWKMVTGQNIAGVTGTAIYCTVNGILSAAVRGQIVGRIVTAQSGGGVADAVVLFAPEATS